MPEYQSEVAASGRAKCRGCERLIAKGTVRFGERVPNLRADGRETTFWYHPQCAAYKRPAAITAYLDDGGELPGASLGEAAAAASGHPRLERLHRAHLSPSARATCRSCKNAIQKDDWRISVVFYEDGYLNPAGYIHASCVKEYTGTTETVMDRLRHFNHELTRSNQAALRKLIAG